MRDGQMRFSISKAIIYAVTMRIAMRVERSTRERESPPHSNEETMLCSSVSFCHLHSFATYTILPHILTPLLHHTDCATPQSTGELNKFRSAFINNAYRTWSVRLFIYIHIYIYICISLLYMCVCGRIEMNT